MMRLFELIKSIVHPTDAASGKRKSTSSTDSTNLKTTERSTLIAESAKSVRRTNVTTVKVMRNNALRTARVLLKNQRSKRFK